MQVVNDVYPTDPHVPQLFDASQHHAGGISQPRGVARDADDPTERRDLATAQPGAEPYVDGDGYLYWPN